MRLEALDITAGYGDKAVLQAVNIGIETGEFVGLIGPNGCGKSTLLRVLSGVLKPQQGQVILDRQDLKTLAPIEIARRVAFVPQSEVAAFEFSVEDVVLMGRHPYRQRFGGATPEDYNEAKRALAATDMLHLADRPITQLSGGEHRRALLARALAQTTPLLLLDEPTAHLDITHQVELLSQVQQLTRREGKPIGALAALHDLNQAAEFCDRLVLLSGGRVEAEGSPETVLTASHLRRTYNANAQVGRNPATGRPSILTLHSNREQSTQSKPPHVHVICGGGSGVGILGILVRNGLRVTTGVLNRLDTDEEAAVALGIEAALEAPYSPFSADACDHARALMADAQIILVTPVPFGRGNLPNLEMAAAAQTAGKEIVLIGDADFAVRDYTSGAATHLFEQLLQGGACRYDRVEDWPGLGN